MTVTQCIAGAIQSAKEKLMPEQNDAIAFHIAANKSFLKPLSARPSQGGIAQKQKRASLGCLARFDWAKRSVVKNLG